MLRSVGTALLLLVWETGLDIDGTVGGCRTALLGPGLRLASPGTLIATDVMPAYFARMACLRARRSAIVSSIGLGAVSSSSSSSGSGSLGREGALVETLVEAEGEGVSP